MRTAARLASGTGATALAIALLGATAGTAAAAPATSDPWYGVNNNSQYWMTVSDSTPKVGDTITLSTSMKRRVAIETITKVKQVVPTCLSYVAGSAVWNDKPVDNIEDGSGEDPGYVLAKGSWTVDGTGKVGNNWSAVSTLAMQFTVNPSCATGEAMPTTMHITGSLNNRTDQDKGPTITVAKGIGGGIGGGLPDLGGSGSLDTGSLGSLLP